MFLRCVVFFFQAEDGIRDLVRSRGLGDVYKRQDVHILKGEYPVAKGLTVGHEPVGVIEKLGSAVQLSLIHI